MLRDAELLSMRASATASLPDDGQIQTLTLVSDGRGGNLEDWQPVTDVRCRVKRLKEPVEVVIGDKVTSMCGFKAWFPYGLTVDVSGEKRLVTSGVTYEIIGGVRNSSEEIFAVAFCNRVE